MVETARHEYEALSTRDGFNRSLRHFKVVNEILQEFEGCRNLADLLNEMIEEKRLELNQVEPIVHAILAGHPRFPYAARSFNLSDNVSEFKSIVEQTSRWSGVDLVITYYHPDLGLTLINPKNEAHWVSVQVLRKNELVTVYAGAFAAGTRDSQFREAADLMIDLLAGRDIKVPTSFTKGSFKPPRPPRAAKAGRAAPAAKKAAARRGRPPAAAPAGKPAEAAPPAAEAAQPGRPQRMTPMYSIPVTNELFHNGNVEAWKRIIASYRAKHAGLDVFIFYDGERIHDINTLFKWGKVKHGSAILIAVAGEDIQDVAKLQRYLRQGASPMFEAFLRFPVNTVLNLF
jgi:hypothetical protein